MSVPSRRKLDALKKENDGHCGEAADTLLHKYDGQLVYVERPGGRLFSSYYESCTLWKYHMFVVINGIVYDPWCSDDGLTLKEYLAKAFGSVRLVVTIDAVDVYTGPADQYVFVGPTKQEEQKECDERF